MAVKKVFTPVGVTFRGDGFYKTDSRSKSSKATPAKAEGTAGDTTASSTNRSSSTTRQSTTSEQLNGSVEEVGRQGHSLSPEDGEPTTSTVASTVTDSP